MTRDLVLEQRRLTLHEVAALYGPYARVVNHFDIARRLPVDWVERERFFLRYRDLIVPGLRP